MNLEDKERLLKRIKRLFNSLNQEFFQGKIPEPEFRLSEKMSRIAGNASPKACRIGISLPYHNKYGWDGELVDTLKHEMIHLYFYMKKRSYNHTDEFKFFCRKVGCSRYSKQMPRRNFKYVYQCPGCNNEFYFRKKVVLACKTCSGGIYNPKYSLKLIKEIG